MFRYVHWFSFNIHHHQAWKPFGFFFEILCQNVIECISGYVFVYVE